MAPYAFPFHFNHGVSDAVPFVTRRLSQLVDDIVIVHFIDLSTPLANEHHVVIVGFRMLATNEGIHAFNFDHPLPFNQGIKGPVHAGGLHAPTRDR